MLSSPPPPRFLGLVLVTYRRSGGCILRMLRHCINYKDMFKLCLGQCPINTTVTLVAVPPPDLGTNQERNQAVHIQQWSENWHHCEHNCKQYSHKFHRDNHLILQTIGVGTSHKAANGMAMAGTTGVMAEDYKWISIKCPDNCSLRCISKLLITPTH